MFILASMQHNILYSHAYVNLNETKHGCPKNIAYKYHINPYLTNGFSHHYQLDESTFIFRGFRSDFLFLSHFSMNIP